ncbi:MAG: serine/threonine protein kinase [Myxococcales bacterium]|nr:serine/threonine protein kinase [Myxococcales bacterium]
MVGSPGAFGLDRDAIGDFELIAKLATGGMAEIFLARRRGGAPGAGGLFVIKRILAHLADDEHFIQMFRDEAELASRIVHPNVCRVYGLDCDRGAWFMVMEYLHGMPLSRIMSLQSRLAKPFPPSVLTALLAQACEGLGFAHELADAAGQPLGLVHRDISPPNLYVTASGAVKVLDFGIAKAKTSSTHTRTGTIKGKNAYMSPEQILGLPLDRRSDVFALGAVMWELVTLRRLFHRDADFATFKAITEQPIPDVRQWCPSTSPAVAEVVAKALARDPADRFETCAAFAAAFEAAAGEAPRPAILAELLATSFADEMAIKDRIVAEVDHERARPTFQAAAQAAFAAEFGNVRPARVSGSDVAAMPSPELIDLRGPSRRRAQRWIGGGLAAIALCVVYALFVAQRSPGDAVAGQPTIGEAAGAKSALGAAKDATPAPPRARALPARDEIEALSKFGFWSFSAPGKAVVYIDGKRVGEAPFVRFALTPGFHDVRVVGPGGKSGSFRIAIYGGQETLTPTWSW